MFLFRVVLLCRGMERYEVFHVIVTKTLDQANVRAGLLKRYFYFVLNVVQTTLIEFKTLLLKSCLNVISLSITVRGLRAAHCLVSSEIQFSSVQFSSLLGICLDLAISCNYSCPIAGSYICEL